VLCQPSLSLRFGHDRHDLDGRAGHIVENADFVDAKSRLRAPKAAKALDAPTTRTSRLVPQMSIEGVPHRASNIRFQRLEVFNSLWRHYNGIVVGNVSVMAESL